MLNNTRIISSSTVIALAMSCWLGSTAHAAELLPCDAVPDQNHGVGPALVELATAAALLPAPGAPVDDALRRVVEAHLRNAWSHLEQIANIGATGTRSGCLRCDLARPGAMGVSALAAAKRLAALTRRVRGEARHNEHDGLVETMMNMRETRASCDLSGIWSTNYGTLALTQSNGMAARVHGSVVYTNGKRGQITGTYDGTSKLTYTWSHSGDKGHGELFLGDGGRALDGWFVGDGGDRGTWKCKRK